MDSSSKTAMKDQEDGKKFKIIKWKIRNFCSWDPKIHEIYLTDCSGDIELFPGGLHGDGDQLVVRVYDESATRIEMSIYGSDGTLLSIQEVKKPKWDDGFKVLPPGPKFHEVVQSRMKNPYRKDILTLICRLEKSKNSWYSSQTSIIVHDVCLRVSSEMFQKIQKGSPKWISRIRGLPEEDSYCEGRFLLRGDLAEDNANDDNDSDYTDIDEESEIEGDGYGSGEMDLFASITDSNHIAFTLKAVLYLSTLKVHFSLSLLDKEKSIGKSQRGDHIFREADVNDDYMEDWMFSDQLLKSEVTKQHSIIIRLKFITKTIGKRVKYSLSFDDCVKRIKPFREEKKSTSLPTASVAVLSRELMALFQDEEHADFHLHCENVTFSLHKGILSARSSVLKSMLSTDMKESASGSMKIEDLDVNTLSRFLSFLYSGTVEDLPWESALKLYYAADKYEVPSLKTECKNVLSSSISILTVCPILALADKHQDEELMSVTHKFILDNFRNVLKSEEWKSFMQSEPHLVSETVTHLTTCLLEK